MGCWEWRIHKVGLGWQEVEQKDGVGRTRGFCEGGVHALKEMDEGRLRLGGPHWR